MNPPDRPRKLHLDALDAVLFFISLYGLAFAADALHLPRFVTRPVLALAFALPAIRHLVAPPAPRVPRPRTAPLGVLAALLLVLGLGAGALGGWMMYAAWFGPEPDWSAEVEQIAASTPHISLLPGMQPPTAAEVHASAERAVEEERASYRAEARARGERGMLTAAVGIALLGLGTVIERLRTRPETEA